MGKQILIREFVPDGTQQVEWPMPGDQIQVASGEQVTSRRSESPLGLHPVIRIEIVQDPEYCVRIGCVFCMNQIDIEGADWSAIDYGGKSSHYDEINASVVKSTKHFD